MQKPVLISIRPKWCEFIKIKQKKWELRKTKPKSKPPFKAYIYETKGLYKGKSGCLFNGLGEVIGEFVCNEIREVYQCNSGWVAENACVTRSEFFDYLGIPQDTHFGYDKKAYAWHITDLKIYDEPKALGEFELASHCFNIKNVECKTNAFGEYVFQYHDNSFCRICKYYNSDFDDCDKPAFQPLKRPPQSWCYVEVQNG